nr:immunoglobulin heavy chain junction region [Macaca mulatta]MOX63917.1 immunoglobulin heavy chain junction region [Macaca mulatta]MOX67462.1 immunoglobulin heavy chain junction region [Macaca mulatta]MOY21263.1 immunoglobulin heavy chain junction region [Macaca mulatta]MOY23090.1 immunoglobulin heavy chain junction region [Macaca mulatta]
CSSGRRQLDFDYW